MLVRFLGAVRRGEAPVVHGSGGDLRDDVYAGDVARAVQMAMAQRARGAFNVASGRPHTILDVARTVCSVGAPGLMPRHDDSRSEWIDRWYLADKARQAFGFTAETPFRDGVLAMWNSGDGL